MYSEQTKVSIVATTVVNQSIWYELVTDMIGGFGILVKSGVTCDKGQILVDTPKVTIRSSMLYSNVCRSS